jgi:hypothetical protein
MARATFKYWEKLAKRSARYPFLNAQVITLRA